MNGEQNNATVSADLFWMKEALKEIKNDQKEIKDTLQDMMRSYVTKEDVASMKKAGDAIHEDHEDRIRGLETAKTEIRTQIQQWGLFGGLLFTVINIIISKYL